MLNFDISNQTKNYVLMRINIITGFILLILSSNIYSQSIGIQFINDADAFFQSYVDNGKIDYHALKTEPSLESLVSDIRTAELDGVSQEMEQAFYINAYNILVIHKVVKAFPIGSVQNVGGFFDRKNVVVSGKKVSLNQIEKDFLIKKFKDARYHFVLVCGAVGCPPISNFAYHPDKLHEQLDTQTKKALNDSGFLNSDGKTVYLSKIFYWYRSDFGGDKKSIIRYINKYRDEDLSDDSRLKYTDYDWSLNDTANNNGLSTGGVASNNELRYVVSSTITKGTFEIKIFNNLYSQKTGSPGDLRDRSTFFTTLLSALYGLSNRLNVGINTRYRKVRNDNLPSSAFSVLGGGESANSARSGLTAFGPQIRYAPVPKWQNFSIQSSFVFPIGNDLAGSSISPYIDWTGPTWNTQFFNDISIGNFFSLFTEIDVLLEDIGSTASGHINRLSTPVTLIFSYNPIANMTLYTLGGYSPYWQIDFDYFTQLGFGFKYQFTPKFELELLYTDFSNQFLNDTDGQASTYNIGLRFNI